MFFNQTQKTVFYNGSASKNALKSMCCSGSSGSNNGGSGSNNGGGGTGSSSNVPIVLNYYNDLALVNETLNNLLYNYSKGNMEYVVKNLTKVVYYNLSLKLAQLRQDASIFPEYENIRVAITRSMEGLYKSVLDYSDCQNMQRKLHDLSEKASILDDMTKLKAYLDSLTGAVNLFPDIEIASITATLKPEIAEYIRLYGLPQAGVFETDKLAIAIQNVSVK